MFVAAAKVVIDDYGNYDLNNKRIQMKQLAQQVHRKFNVGAEEVREEVDDPERCVLGLSLIASSHQEARTKIDQILLHVDGNAFARVTVQDVEIFQFE